MMGCTFMVKSGLLPRKKVVQSFGWTVKSFSLTASYSVENEHSSWAGSIRSMGDRNVLERFSANLSSRLITSCRISLQLSSCFFLMGAINFLGEYIKAIYMLFLIVDMHSSTLRNTPWRVTAVLDNIFQITQESVTMTYLWYDSHCWVYNYGKYMTGRNISCILKRYM